MNENIAKFNETHIINAYKQIQTGQFVKREFFSHTYKCNIIIIRAIKSLVLVLCTKSVPFY